MPQFNQRVHMAVNSQHGNNKSNSNSITSTPAYRCSGVQVRASILSPPMSNNNNNENACRTVRSSKPTTPRDRNIAESSRVYISRERWDGQQTRHVACKHTGQMLTFGEFAFCLWTTETRRRLQLKMGSITKREQSNRQWCEKWIRCGSCKARNSVKIACFGKISGCECTSKPSNRQGGKMSSSGVIRHRWQNKILSTSRKHTRHPRKFNAQQRCA